MKQKDILTIVLVIGLSSIVSYFLSKSLITSPKNRQQKVEVVEKISADFNNSPDPKVFNKNAINSTQIIQIGDSSNNKPINGN